MHGQFKILKQTVNATNLKRWNESTSPSASPTVTTRKTAVEPKTTPVAVHRASRTSRRLSQVILGSDSEDETAPVAMCSVPQLDYGRQGHTAQRFLAE